SAEFTRAAEQPVSTINDLVAGIKSKSIDPAKIEVQRVRLNGTDYILNTRTATALERAGVPRSKWNWRDYSNDPDAVKRLRDQLDRNGLNPGEGINDPTSDGAKGDSSGLSNHDKYH